MTIQFRFFYITVHNLEEAESELNKFLRSVKVLSIEKYFSSVTDNHAWHVAVEYLSGDPTTERSAKRTEKARIDYKKILPPEDFELYSQLRVWRKEQAEKEAIPVYAIFTNEQLAKIAGKRIKSRKALSELDGVGEARVSKYGDLLFAIVEESSQDETDR